MNIDSWYNGLIHNSPFQIGEYAIGIRVDVTIFPSERCKCSNPNNETTANWYKEIPVLQADQVLKCHNWQAVDKVIQVLDKKRFIWNRG